MVPIQVARSFLGSNSFTLCMSRASMMLYSGQQRDELMKIAQEKLDNVEKDTSKVRGICMWGY
jgi:hypothetical protein